jgi:hypothetical protein
VAAGIADEGALLPYVAGADDAAGNVVVEVVVEYVVAVLAGG